MIRRKNKSASTGPGAQPQLSVAQAFGVAVRYMRAGQLRRADEACVKVLGADPMHLDALHLRGVVAFRVGQPERAVAIMERVIKLNPAHAQAQNDLGMILHGMGQHARAEMHLKKALEQSPKMATAYLNLGNVYRSSGQLTAAEKNYRRAIRLKPGLADAYGNLSLVQSNLGRAEDAEKTARKGIKVKPRYGLMHSRLASALDRQGLFDEAIAAHKKAIELQPGLAGPHLDLAYSLAGNGHIEQANASYKEVLKLDPQNVRALDGLVRLNRFTDYNDHIRNMEARVGSNRLSEPDRMLLIFSLAKVFEDIGDFARAFEYLQRGNALNRKSFTYSMATTNSMFSDIEEAFSAEAFSRFSGAGLADDTPIFILGMPRSGTSLAEQIVSSHPDVVGAGELSIMNTIAGKFVSDPTKPGFGEAVARASFEQFGELGRDYLDELRLYSKKARFITDKMPGNLLYVGLIKLILPNAKIVHCRRNPADNCLSIYKTYFASGGLHYAYDLKELGQYYRHYEKLMAHWHQVLPGFVFDLKYEDLIADQRGQTEKLLEWCGLDWSEDCMNFFNNKRLVNTASIAQVRQPVYKSSIRLSQKYGSALDPLLQALDEN